MREIVLDTETTGIGYQDGHRIIEIGAVEMINQFRTGRSFHRYVHPERDISEGAFRVHGISLEFLADKPKFHEIAAELLEFVGDARLVIHNAPFDMGFINHHLTELNLAAIPHNNERVFDTLEFARKKYPGAKNSLDALCARFNISTAAREKHGALLDAELLADVYAEMIGAGSTQKNLLFVGNIQSAIGAAQENSLSVDENKTFRQPRQFAVSEAELAAHEEFLKTVKEPLWHKLAS